jgi:hypothetical protein
MITSMNPIDIIVLFVSVLVALISRASMKRILVRRLGKANAALLEIDFWKASSGEPFGRSLVVIEIVSWAAIIFFAAQLASACL